jgi:hypothetical protein
MYGSDKSIFSAELTSDCAMASRTPASEPHPNYVSNECLVGATRMSGIVTSPRATLRRMPLILILIILLLVFGGGGAYMGPGLGYYGGGGISLVLLIVILYLVFNGRRTRL